jgi:Putative peptidoglycan binding domain/Caspase domain
MTRTHFMTALLGLAFAWCAMPAARSDQLRIALIISNDDYGSQPGPKRCSASATAVRDALRGKGFKIIERNNLDRTEFDSAIGALARQVVASPAPLAVLYYCGYALEFDGQPFLLPISATIARNNDVLGQGIAAKNVVDGLGAAPQSRGFVLLDVFRMPNAQPTGLGRLIEQVIASNFAVIGTSNDGPGEGPTAASLALRDQIGGSEMDLDAFVVRMSRQLSKNSAVAAHFVPAIGPRPGPGASPLPAPATAAASTAASAQPAPAPAASAARQPAPTPAASIAVVPAPAPAVSIAVLPASAAAASIATQPPAPAASIAVLPTPTPSTATAVQAARTPAPSTAAAARVQPAPGPPATATSNTGAVPSPAIAAASTAAPVPPASAPRQPAANASPPAPPPARIVVQTPTLEREDKRLIQTILTQMGYYAGQIDGKFGPETQAAIRRYQSDINVDATGRLTTEQIIKLLCVGCLPPPAPRDDAAYCAGLSSLYRRYLDNAGEGQFAEAKASVAMDECARGNTAVGIPVLEKKLLDARLTAPPAAR